MSHTVTYIKKLIQLMKAEGVQEIKISDLHIALAPQLKTISSSSIISAPSLPDKEKVLLKSKEQKDQEEYEDMIQLALYAVNGDAPIPEALKKRGA